MTAIGFLAVGIGAMFGAWARWGLAYLFNPTFPLLPLGTLAANLIGGFLIGVVLEYFGRHAELSPELRLALVTGFLGALTTFSTFSAEVVSLIARTQYGWATLLAGAHLFGSLCATALGIVTVRFMAA